MTKTGIAAEVDAGGESDANALGVGGRKNAAERHAHQTTIEHSTIDRIDGTRRVGSADDNETSGVVAFIVIANDGIRIAIVRILGIMIDVDDRSDMDERSRGDMIRKRRGETGTDRRRRPRGSKDAKDGRIGRCGRERTLGG